MKDVVEPLDGSNVDEQEKAVGGSARGNHLYEGESMRSEEMTGAEDDVDEEAQEVSSGKDGFEKDDGNPVGIYNMKEVVADGPGDKILETKVENLDETPSEETGTAFNGENERLDVCARGDQEVSSDDTEVDVNSVLDAKSGNDEIDSTADRVPSVIDDDSSCQKKEAYDTNAERSGDTPESIENEELKTTELKGMNTNFDVISSNACSNQQGEIEEMDKSVSQKYSCQSKEHSNSNSVIDCSSDGRVENGGVESSNNDEIADRVGIEDGRAITAEGGKQKTVINNTRSNDNEDDENVKILQKTVGTAGKGNGATEGHVNGSTSEDFVIKEAVEVEYVGPVADTEGNRELKCDESSTSQLDGSQESTSSNHSSVRVSADATDSSSRSEASQDRKADKQVNGEREPQRPSPSTLSSQKSAASSTPIRPAGLGRAAPLLEPASRAQPPRVNGSVPSTQSQQIEDSANVENDEHDETREKLQMIRVKFLRLAHRLGQTPHNVVVAQVLYRLGLAEQLRGRNGSRVGAFSFDRASAMAEQLESTGQLLDFSCTIMVIGKTGVGKSATINSIFDEMKFSTDAFQTGTRKVQDVVGTVQGIKVRVIDTPGLLPSWSDQRRNEKILQSIKHFIKKTPPDIVLYLDRLDMRNRDFGDSPLLKTITEIFGPSIWFNAIVVLTHAASAPPDGPNGNASSYDMFVTQRSHVIQQAIRQAAGDMRLMNPVSLVENHSACRTNRAGQRVLPNGQVWKPHLLLLSFASKILAEANALLKLQDSPPGRPFAVRSKAPPLPFLLSSLLQSRPQVKLPDEQYGDEDDPEYELDESSDSESESEYDQLPPFRRLSKAQMARLTRAQRKEYLDELEYREKLFMKKQMKEEKKRRRMMKKLASAPKDISNENNENVEDEAGGSASVPVPMPDLALPASFDSDNPTHRYRYLDSSNQWLVRPVLETHGWDHDVGYEGVNVERMFVVKEKIPVSFSGQVTKDKKDANIQMELASSIKHREGRSTSLGFDMQNVGKELAYTLRSELRFNSFRKNNAAAGLAVTLLGDTLSAGFKVEDKLIASKRFRLVLAGGAMTGRGDIAYGGSLEAQLRDKDYPLGRFLSTLGLSIMDWHGDLAIGGNIQSQIPVGRSTNLIARANVNNRGSGQVSIRLNSSEQLQIALIAMIPLFKKLVSNPQKMQYGQ